MTRARDLADSADKDISGTLTLDDIVLSNDLTVADNGKAIFGAGSDLQIYHDTSNSIVKENGTGDLWLMGTNIQMKNGANTATYLTASSGGAVTLYHNNASKLATSSSGISVDGNINLGTSSGAGKLFLTSASGFSPKLQEDSNALAIYTNNSERLRISSGGDVGVGSAPSNPGWARNLHVHGSGNGGGLQLTDNTSGSGNNDGLSIASYQGNAFFINRENASMRFSTNDTERMRILSDGSLLLGKTSANLATTGLQATSSGAVVGVTRDGGAAFNVNRLTSDGDLIGLYKDTGRIGGIGVKNDRPFFINPTNFGIRLANNALVATDESGTNEDNASDLGAVDVRWKSLYLSGTIGANSSTAFSSMDGRLMFDNDYSSSALGPNKVVLQAEGNWVGGLGISNNFLDIYTGGGIRFNKSASQTSYSALMTLDASGRLGIGKVPSSATGSMLQVEGNDGIAIRRSGQTNHFVMRPLSSSDGDGIRFTQEGVGDRMRIDSSGNVIFGSTSTSAPTMYFAPDSGGGAFVKITDSTNARNAFTFNNPNGMVGFIETSGSSTSYSTSSDYRLKTNAQPMTGATDRLKHLNPVNFEWIADGTRVDGFLAHEAQAVVPEAVTGTKDEVDDDGNPVYQGIDQSKLVPLLVATIKELEARITALEGV